MTRVLAVIHHEEFGLSVDNAALAERAGCAGVVFIQMGGRDHEIDRPAALTKERYPNLMVGANRLSAEPWEAIRRDRELGLDLSWADEPGVTSRGPGPKVERIREAMAEARKGNRDFQFFGSVAFKTQEPDPDPAEAARVAAREPWVVTTSGKATGSAPEEAKLASMAEAIGARRLAVASGITPANAPSLAPHVGWVLAATGISRSFHELDERLTRDLVEACARHGSAPG